MPEYNLKKLNAIKYTLVVVLMVLGLIIYYYLSHSFLEVSVIPPNSMVSVDNAPIKLSRRGVGKISFKPGMHTVRAEAESYNTVEKTVDFKRGRQTKLDIVLEESAQASTVAEGARFLAYGKEKNEIFYLNDIGNTLYKSILRVGDDGLIAADTNPITSPVLNGINEIILSPNRELALFRKNDGIYLFDFFKYDFVNQTERLWGQNIGDIAWSPDNSKIAYFYAPPTGERTLIFTDVANQAPERVVDLNEAGIENPYLSWSPDSQWLIVISRGAKYDTNKILLFNSYSRTFTTVSESGNQLEAIFSPDSSNILFSTYQKDPANPVTDLLSVMKKDGTDIKSLNIRTKISNTAWVGNFTALMIGALDQVSGFYRVSLFDLETKSNSVVFQASDINQEINSVLVTPDDQILVIQTDQGIYAVNIAGKVEVE